MSGIFDRYQIVRGFIFTCLSIVVVSLMSSAPASDIIELFNRVEGKLAEDN